MSNPSLRNQNKKIRIEFEIPGKACRFHIFEDGKEKNNISNVIIIADADSQEVFYIENLPPDWVESLIKDAKIKIRNPSERY